ncbi:MAG TPA: hypothetical protein VHW90_05955 [Stellaceae bacterium]|nr:hypothetical protein [Stellaceae bacterium]
MAAPAKPMAAKPMAQQRHHRMMAHKGRMWHHARSADSVTDQLNKEELARIQGGPGPAPGGMPMMPPPPPPQIGPRPSGH